MNAGKVYPPTRQVLREIYLGGSSRTRRSQVGLQGLNGFHKRLFDSTMSFFDGMD